MRVIVVGAGRVGSNIAADLCEKHEVVVIDTDEQRADRLTYDLDVLTMTGDGTELATLREAGVEKADLLIASTDDDETNIVVCGAASIEGDAFTVARVRRPQYLSTWKRAHELGSEALGVDLMVCTELLAAETIADVVGIPTAEDVESFGDNAVRMAQFQLSDDSPIADMSVSEADQFPGLTFAAVFRGDETIVPGGETVLRAGDDLVVIGEPSELVGFASQLAPSQSNPDEVVILGGSEIGYQTARILSERGLSPRVVERDEERARWLAERLPDVTVMNYDATDQEFLRRENVGSADVVVAALDTDQRNLLAVLLAKRLGADRAASVVDAAEFTELFEAVGVDAAVSPRTAAAEEITRFTRSRYAETVSMLENGRAEVLELEVGSDSPVVGMTVGEADGAVLPGGVVVGAITRDGEAIIPRGNTVIEAGDHLIIFVETELADAVTDAL